MDNDNKLNGYSEDKEMSFDYDLDNYDTEGSSAYENEVSDSDVQIEAHNKAE